MPFKERIRGNTSIRHFYLAGGSQVTKRAVGDETAAGGETTSGAENKGKFIRSMTTQIKWLL